MKKGLFFVCFLTCYCFSFGQADIQAIIKAAVENLRDTLAQYDYAQKIIMLQEDGKSAILFDISKTTSFNRINLRVDEKIKNEMLYLFPSPLSEVPDEDDSTAALLTMPVGGSTGIYKTNLSEEITYKKDTFIYKTNPRWADDGHFGIAKRGSDFNLLSCAWVFPSTLEPVYYSSNRKGKWTRTGNLIHFAAEKGQNDFLFEIRYVRNFTIPQVLEGRKVAYVDTVDVNRDTIQIAISDPQREDGDIISLNVNGDWKLKNFEVTNAPAKFTFVLDHHENYIAMHAENLGRIPPNTAMITVTYGKVRKQIILNSDTNTTQGVILKR